jgi:hypothetical protein
LQEAVEVDRVSLVVVVELEDTDFLFQEKPRELIQQQKPH